MAGEVYEFGDFKLDAPERLLSREGHAIPLSPKTYDVLLALLRAAGRLATKRELLDLVWPETSVEEGILAVHISSLRKTLGSGYIETVSRAGYRFVAAVKQLDQEESLPAQQSIAVLPARPFFGNIFSERDRHTGLAIADVLTDCLGRFPRILVRPIRAVRAYVSAREEPAAIGRSLRVSAVIDICFLSTADRIKLSVQLIRSRTGGTLWTGNFDEPAAEVVTVADTVADCIAAQFDSEFQPRATRRSAIHPAADPKVYELVGRGRFHLLSYSMFEVPQAVEAFRAAIESDPTYAPAYAGLALACCAKASMRVAPPAEAYDDAKVAALHALAMDDSSADAQVALGAVLFFSEWNWAGAERSLKRALHLNPNHSEGFLIYGQLLEALGRLEEGLQMKLRALERDPFSALVHVQISLSYWNQRRYNDAIEWAKKTLEIDPRHPHAREHLAGAYWKKGNPDRYMAESLKHAELHGAPVELLDRLKQAYANGGLPGVQRLGLEFASNHPEATPAMQLALFHGELGSMDAAFEYLDRAIESHDPGLVHLAVGPQWDCLRRDSRFPGALLQMGLSVV